VRRVDQRDQDDRVEQAGRHGNGSRNGLIRSSVTGGAPLPTGSTGNIGSPYSVASVVCIVPMLTLDLASRVTHRRRSEPSRTRIPWPRARPGRQPIRAFAPSARGPLLLL
jgi:hypothetical protein